MRRAWTINGRFLSQRITGVQRYAREIVRALDAAIVRADPLAEKLDLELVVPRGTDPSFHLDRIPIREVGFGRGHAWEQVMLPLLARGRLINLGNTAPVASRGHIVCIHDLSTRASPESYARLFRIMYDTITPVVARSARSVVTVSDFSAGEIVRQGLVPPDRISVLSNGYEHVEAWTPRHSPATKAAAGPNTIVLIGSLAAHKNIGLILGLAADLAGAGLRIAVVGQRNAQVFAHFGLAAGAANVVWLGAVNDDALAALLRDSLCLAFPSLTEGFGLPPLEAMALGCPIVVSDRASLPEICGDAALYAAPTDPAPWRDHFLALHRDPRLRAELVRRGRAQARRYRWTVSAQGYLDLMARADGFHAGTTEPRPLCGTELSTGTA